MRNAAAPASHHAFDVLERIAAGGFATAVTLLAAITAATLLYVWLVV
jgi:hypothetical protein